MLLRHDVGPFVNDDTEVSSFIVNGVEQLSGPELISYPSNEGGAGSPWYSLGNASSPCSSLRTLEYNPNVVEVLQSLAIPNFIFSHPSAAELSSNSAGFPAGYCSCLAKYMKLEAPIDIDWSFRIRGVSLPTFYTNYSCVGGVITVT